MALIIGNDDHDVGASISFAIERYRARSFGSVNVTGEGEWNGNRQQKQHFRRYHPAHRRLPCSQFTAQVYWPSSLAQFFAEKIPDFFVLKNIRFVSNKSIIQFFEHRAHLDLLFVGNSNFVRETFLFHLDQHGFHS